MNKERKPGYYWVKEFENDPWIIAYYNGQYWECNGKYVDDDYWFKIDENQIIRNG
jgi:hypothetical protein